MFDLNVSRGFCEASDTIDWAARWNTISGLLFCRDFKRERFGEILDLIPYCNSIIKLKGVCNNCDNDALFSHRIIKSDKQVLVNTEEENSYIPLCLFFYLKII